ncbi:pheromone processing endoprotease [Chytriomyces hyalinus]|nr:pheromone processing endoprotease [Chytriomyces hyalinus]
MELQMWLSGLLHLSILTTAFASLPFNSHADPVPTHSHNCTLKRIAFKLKSGDTESIRALQVANDMQMQFVGAVGELRDYFQVSVSVEAMRLRRRDYLEAVEGGQARDEDLHAFVAMLVEQHPEVSWAEAQVPRIPYVRRNVIPARDRIDSAEAKFGIQDPDFKYQWHILNDTPGQVGHDHNVTGAWDLGVFGNGSVVCIVDDGVNYNATDLKDAYYEQGSYDFNEHTLDAGPKLAADRHGTRCAGEIVAAKNKVCGIGIAHQAKVSAVRILGGSLTEADEAASINYKFHENHIYSCSWGPTDDGRTMQGPSTIVADAFLNGVTNGRNGLGSIFVFASGNGGGMGDNCNFDGFTNSIYTITVSSIDRNDKHPQYSESCSANLVVMYSSATQRNDDAIATTDWELGNNGDMCTKSHGGTSAAAPLASAIYALVHSIRPKNHNADDIARPDLSWRDFQHLSVQSAVPVNTQDKTWFKTHAGRMYSHDYGYGKLDAYAILQLAKTWQPVSKQVSIVSPFTAPVSKPGSVIPKEKGDVRVSIDVTDDMLRGNTFGRLEHVTVTVNIEHPRRGSVVVDLVSPNGIVSHLAVARSFDDATTGFSNWTFMTVAHWDENPIGVWQVVVSEYKKESDVQEGSFGTFSTSSRDTPAFGTFNNASITFWGSFSNDTQKYSDKSHFTPDLPATTSASARIHVKQVQNGYKDVSGLLFWVCGCCAVVLAGLVYVLVNGGGGVRGMRSGGKIDGFEAVSDTVE